MTALLAVLLGGGVLVGASALVVDVGRLYVEREELHSGADAAAMAIAQRCARTPTTCAGQAQAIAGQYADANAKDGATAVTVICGTGQGMASCPAQSTNRTACIGTPPPGVPYVEVRTATEMADGTTLLPPALAQAMVGNEGYDGTRVGACSRAAWGPPTTAGGLAIAVSQCNWERMTSNGGVLPTNEQIIYLHDPQREDPDSAFCPKDPSGKTAPGGFGFLDDNSGTCMATGTVPTNWSTSTGNNAHGCDTPLAVYRTSRQIIPLPVYDTVSGTGHNTTYHVVGFAAFVATGWRLSGTSAASNIPPSSVAPRPASSYCAGSERCLYGYFTTTRLAGTPGTGANFGVNVVRVVG